MVSDLFKSALRVGDEVLISGVVFTGLDAVQALNC
jgi:tartrate dehydratase beta subunit/fumarate hydratase class I family protein